MAYFIVGVAVGVALCALGFIIKRTAEFCESLDKGIDSYFKS